MDGVDIKTLPLHWWRSNVGLVSQEPVLFGGTIYDNLTFGQQDVDPEAVASACEVANAMTFIKSAPDGLDTKVCIAAPWLRLAALLLETSSAGRLNAAN